MMQGTKLFASSAKNLPSLIWIPQSNTSSSRRKSWLNPKGKHSNDTLNAAQQSTVALPLPTDSDARRQCQILQRVCALTAPAAPESRQSSQSGTCRKPDARKSPRRVLCLLCSKNY